MNQNKSYIQVYDDKIINYPSVKINIDSEPIVLVYDPKLIAGLNTIGCVFVDESALSNAPYRYSRKSRICLLRESPARGMANYSRELASKFDVVLTFDEQLLKLGPPFKAFYYGTSWINYGRPMPEVVFQKSKLCSFIGSVEHGDTFGYSFRKSVVEWAVTKSDMELWGRGLSPFETKDQVISPYQFSIAMENMQHNYYFTEKLIDCFVTDTVPIYWGCSAIDEFFDDRGMLRFESIEELDSIHKKLSPELYLEMLPYVRENRKRAFDLLLTGQETLCRRLSIEALKFFDNRDSASSPLLRSKPVALLRKLLAR